MKLELNLTKAICILSMIISLGIPKVMSYLGDNIIYNPSNLHFNNLLNLIVPYLFNPTILGFIIGMYIFNYNSSKLENHYGTQKYCLILMLAFFLTSFLGLVISLIFKNLFEYSIFYNTSYFGIIPITLCLRALYYNKIDRDVLLFGHEINSKNIIWIELLIMNIGNTSNSFGIQLAGVLAGHVLYNFLRC